MAAPIAGPQAAQAAAQTAQSKGPQQAPKQGPSSFDKTMGAKNAQAADAAKATQQVQQAEGVKKAQSVQHVENVQKSEKAQLKRIKRDTTVNEKPGLDKTTQGLANLLEDIEKGQGVMDKLIKAASRGRDFSNSELISLQAGMYKYTQELELTGKVVEKATSGLKDTLKTQV